MPYYERQMIGLAVPFFFLSLMFGFVPMEEIEGIIFLSMNLKDFLALFFAIGSFVFLDQAWRGALGAHVVEFIKRMSGFE